MVARQKKIQLKILPLRPFHARDMVMVGMARSIKRWSGIRGEASAAPGSSATGNTMPTRMAVLTKMARDEPETVRVPRPSSKT
ncbi:hypothetical protein BGZ61DRAFT_439224 [Ilyonectria robusta]|uniref:uncharacterized protein n=1 Tax=Ilyonectria robusta TaxID=1079257 RepID=UPI001E8DCDF5|nr:uncharacterized protein BGZ61DRAFT_439224 [Ilyonectria robusta]KAH8737910.1 hypothetical protein BGZ61DRAFT_439224 [Ilyonectria robusta]